MVICLERGADLHMAQLMRLPLAVSCSSNIQSGFTFVVPAHPGSPKQRAVKWVCACVCNMPSACSAVTLLSGGALLSHLVDQETMRLRDDFLTLFFSALKLFIC